MKVCLNERHKMAWMAFAEKVMTSTNESNKVIFPGEKKINLDWPDGFSFHFHDLRKEELILSERQVGRGSVMVWAKEMQLSVSYNSGKLSGVSEVIRMTWQNVHQSSSNIMFQYIP